MERVTNYHPDLLTRAVTEKITSEIPAQEAVKDVFTEAAKQTLFIRGLVDIGGVSLGGRTLREKLLHCKTFDFAASISSNGEQVDGEMTPRNVRTFWMLDYLKRFPTHRMTTPDLDFVLEGEDLGRIASTFKGLGFAVNELQASNGVRIAEVVGNNGLATFSLMSESWHCKDFWPKLGTIHAPLEGSSSEPAFRVNATWGNVHLYPLCNAGMGYGELKNPSDLRNIASVGRALLMSFTTAVPNPNFGFPGEPEHVMVALPMTGYREHFYRVVEQYVSLVQKINTHQIDGKPYESGLRDMSTALFEIELKHSGWDKARGDDFFGQISASYWAGKKYLR